MMVQFETYSDREVILEASGRDFMLEIKNTGTFDYGNATFAYLTPETIVETLNKLPGFKVEYDSLIGLPRTEDSIVKRHGKSFVRSEEQFPEDLCVWVRVSDGHRFTDAEVAKDGNFEVVYDAGVK